MTNRTLCALTLIWASSLVAGEAVQEVKPLWTCNLDGRAAAPLWANANVVIVTDRRMRSADNSSQLMYMGLQTASGRKSWKINRPETNIPGDSTIGAPAVFQDHVFLLFAPGVLHTIRLVADKSSPWDDFDFAKYYDARAPLKGYASSPLIYDGKMFLNPGAQSASVVALHPITRDVIWTAPGRRASRSDFIAGEFGGVKQVIGFDHDSLGGWAVGNGERLWQIYTPDRLEDAIEKLFETRGQLLVSTCDGKVAHYGFKKDGTIDEKPIASRIERSEQIEVLAGRLALGRNSNGSVYALNLDDNLKESWRLDEAEVPRAAFLMVEDNRLFVFSADGLLTAYDFTMSKAERVTTIKLSDSITVRPAIAAGKLFICSAARLYCFQMKTLNLSKP